jgi:hypothetical protein
MTQFNNYQLSKWFISSKNHREPSLYTHLFVIFYMNCFFTFVIVSANTLLREDYLNTSLNRKRK